MTVWTAGTEVPGAIAPSARCFQVGALDCQEDAASASCYIAGQTLLPWATLSQIWLSCWGYRCAWLSLAGKMSFQVAVVGVIYNSWTSGAAPGAARS